MTELMYSMIYFVARIHDKIMDINYLNGYGYDDKKLHFIVMGVVGMAMLLIIYPIFKWLSNRSVLTIAFIYVATVMVVMTFAIEIGQWLTGTGSMEMDDVVAGLSGFLYLFIIFAIARAVVLGIYHAITGKKKGNQKKSRRGEEY